MKRFLSYSFILFLLGFCVFLSFSTLLPIVKMPDEKPKDEFSVHRAFAHVEKIAQEPHYTGSENHSKVRNYIIDELQGLELNVHTQSDFVLNDYGVLTYPENIVTKIEGSNPQSGSDLLVLAHYDSDPHSSLGASDDASAIAAILETFRALKEQKFKPENNIILVITDAEEIGLLGAQLFAEQHTWMNNIGLMLNFEARGSGGPSNAIIETNHGNAELIKSFSKANPEFPMASSLMFEIYQTMPNDTDATVFREKEDIPGFFFAFIDGHYNYHAATDMPENLDKNSLAHQGSYLSALLPYLGNENLKEFNQENNRVFFNFPFFKVFHYSYGWIFPLLILAWIGFFLLITWGLRQRSLDRRNIVQGLKAFILSLILCAALGFFGWQLICEVYPHYAEIQQGFPYNGHYYIAVFVLLSLSVLLWVYHYFHHKGKQMDLLIAPLLFWLLINTGLAIAFKGASYFIIPVLFMEIACGIILWRPHSNSLLMFVCGIPAIFIFSPLIVYVPVALGMDMMYGGLLLLVLLFVLLLPLAINYRRKDILGMLTFIGALIFIVKAHLNSGFTEENPKPNSLVYYLDKDKNKAFWQTYDHILDDWTEQYITKRQRPVDNQLVMSSKYGKGISFSDPAPLKDFAGADFKLQKDTADGELVAYELKIAQKRPMNRIDIFTKQAADIQSASVNGIAMDDKLDEASKIKRSDSGEDLRLLTYYPVDQDTLQLNFSLPKGIKPVLELYGASYDLLDDQELNVSERSGNMMPKPFVINDAVITKQTIEY